MSSIKKADSPINTVGATQILADIVDVDYDDNEAVIGFFSANKSDLDAKVSEVKKAAVAAQIDALKAELDQL